ncbi:DNA-3-methyladenine glycosylase-like [Cylas formicarius]|uniref:DNA-3-methyladenine glycosylase-like n=1 Tax=Cylas formicarius TaxID=197179 RepID=UPI002958AD75|nr:DNA-3-methyladenine glycosylase-like [Cylas formicarius]
MSGLNLQRITDLDIACQTMAFDFLGKILARRLDDGTVLRGRIVETECYPGGEDKASHSHNGRRTPSNEPMYMAAGTSYVYMTYGMYHCFNISSKEPGAAVLLRALEPVEGLDVMQRLRKDRKKKLDDRQLKVDELCNGPSKLCISLNITKIECNKLDLTQSDTLWLEHDPEFSARNIQVVKTSRIGIASAGEEWSKKPLRFYILGNPSVSKRDKNLETKLNSVDFSD